MAKSATKLKAVEAEPDPARQPLAAALAKVAELKAAIAANTAEQEEAAAKVRELEAELEDKKRALEHCPALERRPLRAAIAELEETVRDYRDHAGELQKKASDSFSGLRSKLDSAEIDVKRARSDLLKGHPFAADLLRRLNELRAETAQITADLAALAAVGGVAEGWAAVNTVNPPPSPALVNWTNALLIDANAEFSE